MSSDDAVLGQERRIRQLRLCHDDSIRRIPCPGLFERQTDQRDYQPRARSQGHGRFCGAW